jgi:pimeloyl-ACP methyl ester carboxylesterase
MRSLISRLIYPGASRSVDVGQVERTLQPEDALTRPWMANELTNAMGGHARLVSLPGVGHNDMLRSGKRLWNVVKDFLNPAANASG